MPRALKIAANNFKLLSIYYYEMEMSQEFKYILLYYSTNILDFIFYNTPQIAAEQTDSGFYKFVLLG